MPTDLKSKRKVHIFSTGVHNGKKFDIADLDEMVHAFKDTTGTWQRPALKIGHDDEQLFLQKEGLPAAGWVDNIYRIGEDLFADFVDIPSKIYTLIENKAYRRVSIEQYANVKFGDKLYRYMVGAIALLGADMPGVMDLNDILSFYDLENRTKIESIKSHQATAENLYFSFENKENPQEDPAMTEAEKLKAELDAANAKLKANEAEVSKFKADADEQKKRADKAEQEAADAKKEKFASDKKAREAELDRQVESLVSEKKITKGMVPYVKALLGEQPEANKFSIKVNEKETTFTKFELVKEIADLFAKKTTVNTEESSVEGEQGGDKNQPTPEEVEKYAKENKVSFGEATKALLRKFTLKKTEQVKES